ncbi:beta-1,3-glucosyltransferase isoform X1 [Drosophila elegans]|uniref:beta-1,3-glucosyltransferase isoform X1 n=1 Tax=Drosophila elegans TaxID=30023 RepID=UPI0007E6002A|nr:beta-1,3-glucosyltransferase isoform X1 [Drosophila elegans]XP_017130885.1 beta-1,3-glucosyltransferase isoform X1 [Drosophila elegans]
MTSGKCAVLGLLFFVGLCWGRVEPREVLLVIACPHLPRQARDECFALSDNVREQHRQLDLAEIFPGDYTLRVYVMHELFNYWTLLDALPHLQGQTRLLGARTEWIIWCQHNTRVSSLRGLLEQLRRQDPMELSFHGHALYDSEATIIHHFSNYKDPQWFPYPMLSAGVVFTGVLLRRLAEVVASNTQNITLRSDFSIDASHELARFIYDNISPDPHAGTPMSARIVLKSASYICPTFESMRAPEIPNRGPRCMLHAKPEEPSAGPPSTLGHLKERCVYTTGSHIYFAIKTCAKFHKERITIIERTWAADAQNRRYYSDVADGGIPTISTGIPNVQTGHCAKTMAILQLSLKDIGEQMDIRWLMLVDDDTLLSVPRVSALLSCHNHSDLVYLGQRYGYRLRAPDGFNYHTGGAGILLSLPLVRLIVERCSCPSAGAPDDMILGYCLQALGVAAVPAAGMHQARPQDYAEELLQLQPPVSFHKFWNSDPEYTYRRYLGGSLANGSAPMAAYKDQATAAPLHLLGLQPCPDGVGLLQEAGLESSGKHLDL